MIKGTTEIILSDTKTGETQTIYKHNMVTNALSDIFKQEGYMKSANLMLGNTFQPPYSTLLGGILLFDKALPEDVTKYFAPADANLTACGAYGVKNATGDSLQGDFNSDESYINYAEKTMKYVYDFPTSKGNGTIASVCLTSKNGGYSSYGSNDYTGVSTNAPFFLNTANYDSSAPRKLRDADEYLITLDCKKDRVYTFRPNLDSKGLASSVTIRERDAHMKKMSVLNSAGDPGTIRSTKDVAITAIYANSEQYFSYNYDGIDDALYLVGSSSGTNVSNGGVIQVIKIPMTTMIPESFSLENSCGEYVNVSNAYVYQGCLYISSNNTKIYQIDLANAEDIAEISFVQSFLSLKYIIPLAGRLYLPGYASSNQNNMMQIFDLSTISQRYTQNCVQTPTSYTTKFRYLPVRGSDIVFLRDCNSSNNAGNVVFYIPCNFLVTINNLSAPVTKTETQTMKVVYTITESE